MTNLHTRVRYYWLLMFLPIAVISQLHVQGLAWNIVFSVLIGSWLLALLGLGVFEIVHSQHRRRHLLVVLAVILAAAAVSATRVSPRALADICGALLLGGSAAAFIMHFYSALFIPRMRERLRNRYFWGLVLSLAAITAASATLPIWQTHAIPFALSTYYAIAAGVAVGLAVLFAYLLPKMLPPATHPTEL
jgi:hypothetical protein